MHRCISPCDNIERMPDANQMDFGVKVAAVIAASVSACFGIVTYRRSTRTKAAEFLSALHKDFFVEKTYKKTRDILDDESETAYSKLEAFVRDEPAEFTDFLNFFELVAYMGKCGTLSDADVEALLGYYLQILTDKPELRRYIHNRKKGFEHLDELLTRRKKGR